MRILTFELVGRLSEGFWLFFFFFWGGSLRRLVGDVQIERWGFAKLGLICAKVVLEVAYKIGG
jgi:hypothetical protein